MTTKKTKQLKTNKRPKRALPSKQEAELPGMVLNKYIACAGLCSRRKAEQLVVDGVVTINDIVIKKKSYRVKPDDLVKVRGKIIKPAKKRVYILLNKPKDYITTVSDHT